MPVERKAHEKYQALPASPLRDLIDASILLAPPAATSSDGFGPELFAKIRMTQSNTCPMLTTDRLCQIQAQVGEDYLPHLCAIYPRMIHSVGGVEEKSLAFSCPEAVRTVLFNRIQWKAVHFEGPAEGAEPAASAPAAYWPVLRTVLEIARNRAYPLWERLLLLGTLCHRLDTMAASDPQQSISEFLSGFSDAVAAGTVRPTMANQPFDLGAQLDAVLRLAGLMLNRSNVTKRFVDCIEAFATGIGNGPGATLESLTVGYSAAHDRFFAPFMHRNPHVLENWLINTILRCRFPFGPEAMKSGANPSMTQEFAKLAAQFALIKGLLIGVSGFHAEAFSAEHVVHTVQAASKHFDHHPEFPRLAFELLVECKLDGLYGAVILLRNGEEPKPRQIAPARRLPPPAIPNPDLAHVAGTAGSRAAS